MAIETLTTQKRIVILSAANSDESKYLSEQNQAQFGTNRRSEILGIMGDIGQPFEKRYNDYIKNL